MKNTTIAGVLAICAISWPPVANAQDTMAPQASSGTVQRPMTAAMTEAEANKAKMKEPPKFLSGPKAVLPDEERLAGHNGTALVAGIVDAEGNFTELWLRQSTEAPELDRLALEAAKATTFKPATDANGTKLAVPIVMPFEFYSSKSSEPGGGLVHYTCDQFVRDTDWWKSVHPDAKWADYQLYTFMVGFTILTNSNPNTLERFKAGTAVAEQWPKWIDACRNHPDQLFVDQTGSLAPGLYAVAKLAKKQKNK